MHGDIKPENIIICNYKDPNDEPLIKLISFKKAIKFAPGQSFSDLNRYTVAYRAPEVALGNYDYRCEVWSLGVILYLMITKLLPFDGENEDQVHYRLKNVANQVYLCRDREFWGKQDEGMVDLLLKMLEYRPAKRITSLSCCNHSWFKQLYQNDNIEEQRLKSKENRHLIQNALAFNGGKLQRAIMTFMIENLVSNEEKKGLKRIFDDIDKDFTGSIDKQEMAAAFRKMGIANVKEEVDKIFAFVDQDGTGEIEFTEWCTATINKDILLSPSRLRKAFNHFDADRSGTIDLEEFRQIFSIKPDTDDDFVLQKLIL